MSQHTSENLSSMVFGFILAVGNHIYGWFGTILEVNGTQLNDYTQALITGGIGAVGAFFTNRLLKFIEKKIKYNKDGIKQTT
jgi:hypothetical protein